MNQTVPSFVRTYVPLVVAWLVGWLLSLGIEIDDSTQLVLVTGLSGLAAALYYAVVRWLEKRFPAIGLFLGSAKQPVYVDPTKTPAQQSVAVDTAVVAVAKEPGSVDYY